jgi:hypothetical protein
VIDVAHNIPANEVTPIGTKEMLAARDGLHPALVDLLVDAAREIHGAQGFFEEAGEFPGTTQIDLRVSTDADRHKHFGPSFLHQYLPFWVATIAERAIIIWLPIAVVVFPFFNYLPQFLRWRVRSRVYRWYGGLALLERVGGELIVTPRSASGTNRGNAAAKRSDQAQQERGRVLWRVALAWSRRARDERDGRCNSL